ncbi:DUF6660 family protein [Hymenobacter sublimis]|uniref:DUF6660 family protein n=1 Tax=Hymenobacter sublimis TaxID=2933777 RepID=UPI002880ABB3|nr:DUF6660 family protein [Hymenobacter sublimis]
MRFFSVFFAVYIAVLACLPCADEAPAWAFGSRTQVEATEHGPGSDTHLEWCSPLCQCHSCPGTTLPVTIAVAVGEPAQEYAGPRFFPRLASPAARQRAGSIWQPPQA